MTLKMNEELYCDRFDKNYFECWHDRIRKVNSLIGEAEGKILDVGCGDGYITELIIKNKKLKHTAWILLNQYCKSTKTGN